MEEREIEGIKMKNNNKTPFLATHIYFRAHLYSNELMK